jgi:prevent-host-death family protein
MTRPVFTTSDLSRKSGDIIAEAMRQPVTITQRNKPRFVLLNVEDYERLREYADHRQVLTPETIDEELMAQIEKAIEEYAKSED